MTVPPILRLPVLSALAALFACGGDASDTSTLDDTAAPDGPGGLAIVTSWSGAQPDQNGYIFTVDGGEPQSIGADATVTLEDMPLGEHTVELSGVADNCELDGSASLTVDVVAGSVVEAAFAVTCTAILTDQIVFVSDRSGGLEIYVTAPVSGATAASITASLPADVEATSPAVSPDGRTIAHVRRDGGADPEVWLMDADGANARFLASGATPAWSPDGTQIAYAADGNNGDDIFVIHADGTGGDQLTNTATFNESHPTWSPDGARIAYGKSSVDQKIWVMDADGGNQGALTGLLGDEAWPAWSPDGTQIAYSSTRVRMIDLIPTGDHEIHIIGADGTGDRFLVSNIVDDSHPTWSPDGTQIAFTSPGELGDLEIFVVDASGGSASVNITDDPDDDLTTSGSWAP